MRARDRLRDDLSRKLVPVGDVYDWTRRSQVKRNLQRALVVLMPVAVCLAASPSALAAHRCSISPYGTAQASNLTSCPFVRAVALKWIHGARYPGQREPLVTLTRANVWSPVTHKMYTVRYHWDGRRWGGHIMAWTSGTDSWLRFQCFIDPPGNYQTKERDVPGPVDEAR
jgi:hypothetical protein